MEDKMTHPIPIPSEAQVNQLKFVCPVCGSSDFGLMETGATTYSPILGVSPEGRITWGDTDDEDEDEDDIEESWYECVHCGYQLENDGDPISADSVELIEWLKNHNGNQQESGAQD